ncbi:protein TolR [Desulfatiglans anilini]|uniref:protein TolR n=1 Tax=Desulfatiglans anilini TaxID=90728 RepID=UPI0004053063|nr:protein TolR [Desulfatiglans anilini]
MGHIGDQKKFMSEINVTPLVDVMLVLLIIFMVTTPMLMQGVDVNLPKTDARPIKTKEDPLIITIQKDQKILFEDHEMPMEGLETKISKIFENRRDKEVLLRADRDVSYGFVMQVIARVKAAGIDKLGMVTEPLE